MALNIQWMPILSFKLNRYNALGRIVEASTPM